MRRSPNSHRQVHPRPDPSSQSSIVNSFKIDSITNASSITLLDLNIEKFRERLSREMLSIVYIHR